MYNLIQHSGYLNAFQRKYLPQFLHVHVHTYIYIYVCKYSIDNNLEDNIDIK